MNGYLIILSTGNEFGYTNVYEKFFLNKNNADRYVKKNEANFDRTARSKRLWR